MTARLEQANVYTLDPAHTTIEFVVRHLMIAKVRGRFTSFDGTIEVARGSNLPTKIVATIDPASVDTRQDQRDAHLRSPDFFDVEKFPALSFESTRIEGTPDEFTLDGKLTIHGVTRNVTLTGTFEGIAKGPDGNTRAGYTAHGTISRKDFGLTYNAVVETGGVAIGDEVRIELNVEAILQP